MKILMAPMNMANMPIQLVNELRARGHVAEHVQYTLGQGHKFGYQLDIEVDITANGGRVNAHAKTLKSYLERDFDIFHFWNKTLFFENHYQANTGFDLPLIKSRHKRIAYRFTGFDARLPYLDKTINKYSPFNQGFKHLYDEELQKKYLAFLGEYVDQFIVQDPEMGQFIENAKIVPRALDLSVWKPCYPTPTKVPLVIHAPSKPLIKGTKFIEDAIAELQKEGVVFEYKRIENMAHEEAISHYKKADIIVDQILIGALGVLTLEGWALGKPVIVFLREDLFNDFYDTDNLPVGNANPDTIKQVLKQLVEDYDLRLNLGKRARKLAEKYHHLPTVTDGLVKIYENMMASPVTYPLGTADVDYLQAQTLLIETGHKAKNLNQFVLARKNNVGLMRAARHISNATEINKKIQLTDAVVERRKVALERLIVKARKNKKDLPYGIFTDLLSRYMSIHELRDQKYDLLKKQMNLAANQFSQGDVTVNKAQFASLDVNERLILLSHLLPKWVIILMKPLIILRRFLKYGKLNPGNPKPE